MDDCTCDLRTRLISDGCSVCNPTLALECADETIAELRAVNAELLDALEGLIKASPRQYDASLTKAWSTIARARG